MLAKTVEVGERKVRLNGITGSPVTFIEKPFEAVKSAGRVLDILEFFRRIERPARGAEIASHLGIPRSSANVILKTLVDRGYLTFDRKKEYFPSFYLVGFGNWLSSFYLGPTRLSTMLDDLRNRTGHAVALTMRNELDMQFVAMLSPPGIPQVLVEGHRWSIIGSTIGAAYLMTVEDEEVLDILWKSSKGLTRRQRDDEAQALLATIRRFRRQGYATTQWAPHVENTRTLAMPLPRLRSNVPLILSIAGSAREIEVNEKELIATMRGCVDEHLGPHPMNDAA